MMYFALLTFFILEYVRPGSYIPGLNAIHLNSLVPIVMIVGTLAMKTKYSNEEVLAESNSKAILCLLGLIVMSFVIADVTMYTFEIFTTVLGYSLMYFVITKQVTELRHVKGLFAVLIFVHLLLAALTPQMLTDPGTRHYIASGTFLGDGNDYALSVCLTVPMAVFLLVDGQRFVIKFLAGLSILILVFCVISTQSRGGTLALGFTAFYYWLKSPKKMVTAAIGVVAVAAVLVVAPPAYFQRMNTISNYETDGSAQGRITAWTAGVGMALSNPLLGVGAGQFPANFIKFAPGDETRWKTAHSIYFLILGELGLPGLGLLFYFIFSNLSRNGRLSALVKKNPNVNTSVHVQLLACLSVSVIAYAIAGAFLSATYYPHMFVLAGLLVSARRLAREESEAQKQTPPNKLASAKVVAVGSSRLLPGPLLGRRPVTKPAMTSPDLVPPNGRFF
jgi:putative inorganic carbon (HCO3(-)) transporter